MLNEDLKSAADALCWHDRPTLGGHVNRAISLLERWNKAIMPLTIGGSEYYNDPERCAECIKQSIEFQVNMAVAKERKRWEHATGTKFVDI